MTRVQSWIARKRAVLAMLEEKEVESGVKGDVVRPAPWCNLQGAFCQRRAADPAVAGTNFAPEK
jgi:hypothetical protein